MTVEPGRRPAHEPPEARGTNASDSLDTTPLAAPGQHGPHERRAAAWLTAADALAQERLQEGGADYDNYEGDSQLTPAPQARHRHKVIRDIEAPRATQRGRFTRTAAPPCGPNLANPDREGLFFEMTSRTLYPLCDTNGGGGGGDDDAAVVKRHVAVGNVRGDLGCFDYEASQNGE